MGNWKILTSMTLLLWLTKWYFQHSLNKISHYLPQTSYGIYISINYFLVQFLNMGLDNMTLARERDRSCFFSYCTLLIWSAFKCNLFFVYIIKTYEGGNPLMKLFSKPFLNGKQIETLLPANTFHLPRNLRDEGVWWKVYFLVVTEICQYLMLSHRVIRNKPYQVIFWLCK